MRAEATDRESGQTIAEIIAFHAQRAAEAYAIRAPGRDPLTYGGLQASVASVSQALHEMGFGHTDRVAIVLPNGPEMAVASLAVASSMTCAPLNPSYREDDFAFFFGDLGIKAVIVDSGRDTPAIAAARRLSVAVIELVARSDEPAGVFELRQQGLGRTIRWQEVGADDVALVLHTSGTTARPKIVPLTQRNLCTSADNIRRTLGLNPADACLNVMPLFHIHGLVGGLLSSISAGASIVCSAGFRGDEFFSWLRESQATWYSAVPTVHQAVLAAAVERPRPTDGCRLRFIRSSSAGLAPRVMADLAALFAVPVIEAYGMTEASHQMASNPLRVGSQKPGSVGLPAGCDIALMGESGRLHNGDGVVGEIVIRGDGVTRGYESNPQANREAFVDGWFRTGDQGYFDDDGYLFLTGRLKELINRGGEKIAPREVEEALLQHAAVAQAVAFAVPHERLGEEVGAAVVLKAGAQVSASELRQVAEGHLAYFKVPRVIEIIDQIPMGPTGKLQRTGLAATLGLVGRPEAHSDAPRTALEQTLADHWARLLNVDRVGIEDDFFLLGGDSLAATELILYASDLLHREIPIVEFLAHPTIAGLIEIGQRADEVCGNAELSDVITLQATGDDLSIFCPAPHDNSFWRISRLVRHLGKERPVYGLLSPQVVARGTICTVEQLAERYIATMRRMQPEGPYHLIGPCFGGVVAFEMARQLERQRHRVGLLVMIDAFNPAWQRTNTSKSPTRVRANHLLQRARSQWTKLLRLKSDGRIAYLQTRLKLLFEDSGRAARQRWFNLVMRAGLPRPLVLQDVGYANIWAQGRYTPGSYSGDALMFWAAMPIAGMYRLPYLGWGNLIEGTVVMNELSCEPRELWWNEGYVQEMASVIRKRLGERSTADASLATPGATLAVRRTSHA